MHWNGKMIANSIIIEGNPTKINPNGVDIGASEVYRIPEDGTVTINGATREVSPEKQKIKPDNGFYKLPKGIYEIRTDVKVRIPQNAVGIAVPRSTLNRLGVIKSESALWDSGYEGYGTLTVYVGVKELVIAENEAWFQFTVNDAHDADTTYDEVSGHYQDEKPDEE